MAASSAIAPSHLAVIGMGGTIDKDYPRSTRGYAFEIDEPAAERVLSAMPFLHVEWRVESLVRKDSTEITTADRDLLVAAVRRAPEERIVVTHGTDTLIESARHLHASGAAAQKAVAFVGAMKPERFKDSDAPFNLGVAVGATALLPAGSVVLAMGGNVLDCLAVERDLSTGHFVANAAAAAASEAAAESAGPPSRKRAIDDV